MNHGRVDYFAGQPITTSHIDVIALCSNCSGVLEHLVTGKILDDGKSCSVILKCEDCGMEHHLAVSLTTRQQMGRPGRQMVGA